MSRSDLWLVVPLLVTVAVVTISKVGTGSPAPPQFEPDIWDDFVCGTVEVAVQCDNESSTVACTTGTGFCSFCDAPNPSAYVERCLPEESSQCENTWAGADVNVDCGERMSGTCNGSGTCVSTIGSGNQCSDIKADGCD